MIASLGSLRDVLADAEPQDWPTSATTLRSS